MQLINTIRGLRLNENHHFSVGPVVNIKDKQEF